MGSFFLHNTSNTVAKMPAIISYPPIDGEELERSGLESSFSHISTGVKDICCSLVQEDQLTGGGHILPFSTELDSDKDGSSHTTEVSENNPELSQAFSTHCGTGLQTQQDPKEAEPVGSRSEAVEPSEEPYRMSLQALLKKSQEYRRRQRMLRNQAKTPRSQERIQEEQNLSDKENEEFPNKETVTVERRGPLILTMEKSAKTSWGNEGMSENVLSNEEKRRVEEETAFKNHKVNSSLDGTGEPEEVASLVQQQLLLTETSQVQEPGCSATCPRRYQTIPAPSFCRSPVRCGAGLNKDLHRAAAEARSSQHIDQLESSLSSLKVLISDLRSTVKDNLDSSTHSDTQRSEPLRSDQRPQVCPSDCDSLEKKVRDEAGGSDAEYRRPSEGTGPEPSFALSDLSVHDKENELSLVRRQDQTLLPEVSRSAPPDPTVPGIASVLSDRSNRPVDPDSASLNQSYDVDTPSDLWLLSGSGSDSGSRHHVSQEKHRTPEGGGEGHSGVNKVKRKLLMVTEELQDRRASVVRPNSSTPRGTNVCLCVNQSKEEHLLLMYLLVLICSPAVRSETEAGPSPAGRAPETTGRAAAGGTPEGVCGC